MRDAWNPGVYGRFQDERSQPFHDLLKMARPCPGMRILDLGCGPGELTRHLHEQLSARETIGLDSSENMLEKARAHEGGGLRFVLGKIEDLPVQGQFDLIFSNAALQWVPGHEQLFPRILEQLAPGGQFAVQLPSDEGSPHRAAARDVAAEFHEPLGGYVCRLEVLSAEAYSRLLFRLGFAEQQVIIRIYPYVLHSLDGVTEWYRGSMLTAYQRRLDAATFERFVARYAGLLNERCEDAQPYFFPFPRVLFWAKKPE